MKNLSQEEISKTLNLHANTIQINGTLGEKADQLMLMFKKVEDNIFGEQISEKPLDALAEMCKMPKQEILEGKSMAPKEVLERLKENRKKVIDTEQ